MEVRLRDAQVRVVVLTTTTAGLKGMDGVGSYVTRVTRANGRTMNEGEDA